MDCTRVHGEENYLELMTGILQGHRFAVVITVARYALEKISRAPAEDILHERGIELGYEIIRFGHQRLLAI